MKRKRIYLSICLILKYLFAMLFPILTVVIHKMTWRYIVVAAAEVVLIAFLTNLLCHAKSWPGYIFNTAALLLMNVQFAVLYWGSTFVSVIMLTNLDSINAISGKIFVYSLTVAAVLLFSFLPVCLIPGSKKTDIALGSAAAVLYAGIIFTGITEYSPYRAVYTLYQQMERNRMTEMAVKEAMSDMAVMAVMAEKEVDEIISSMEDSTESDTKQLQKKEGFYSDFVSDYIEKPEDIPENPNVILIFVEGMSQNIMDDPRNIMPNVSALQDDSISFANYYNHTFATYMGLSGQLYSGYQRDHYDVNHLVSAQDIFKSYGYRTTFINTEPENKEFSEYLANFGFDELLSDKNRLDGMANAISDKSAYEMLFETALEQNKDETPFFLAMYSFGTHATLNGVHERFADGSNTLLNRFYDVDVQIGTFLNQFNESELAKDTIIVLTTDHATYQDADFVTAFPDYNREVATLDRVPLMIYYKGIIPKQYDVNGRNSLDMVPTILDFLDMSAPNYFLGDSLFTPESGSSYDTFFESVGSSYCTADGEINILSTDQLKEFEKRLAIYYVMKLSDDLMEEEPEDAEYVYAELKDDHTAVMAEIYNADTWDIFNIAFWSDECGQDDLKWFDVSGNHESSLIYEIDLSDYNREGIYNLHVYGRMEDDDEMINVGKTNVYVDKISEGGDG